MDGHDTVEHPPVRSTKEAPETLVLRGHPRRVVRFRKGLIVGLTGSLSVAIIVVTWLALEPSSFRFAPTDEPARVASNVAADTLSGAPADYGSVPKLGPPLPGDLGRPILERQRELAGSPLSAQEQTISGPQTDSVAAERDRLQNEEQAARRSALAVALAARPGAGAAGNPGVESATKTESVQAPGKVSGAPSYNTLLAGSVIPASLITGLNSELPGLVVAQVTENVRDSVTGSVVLIPQGSRLIGKYENEVAYGQKRALVAWQRLILPNGTSLAIDDMPATDPGGYSGLRDRVDAHTWQLLKGIALSTLLSVGSELRMDGGGPLARAVREATQQAGSKAGDQLVSKTLDIRPTLTVRPGWPVRVLVGKDLVLEPWSE